MTKRVAVLVPVLVAVVACGGKPPPAPATIPEPTPTPAHEPMPEAKPMPEPVITQTAAPQNLTFPEEEFRTHQPGATAPRPFRLPPVKQFTLDSGITVFLVEQHELPLVSMDLNFDGGAITDPKGKDGLTNVCMAMLTEGTAQLDKIAYSEALADTASSINAYAGDDSQGLGLASLTKHLPSTFALFADTLRSPGMRPSDFDRMIKRRIESVKQTRGTPTAIPNRVSGPVLYGLEHPLGGVVTEASLAAITLDDCKHQLATWLQPQRARLFVVGDLTEAQIRDTFAKSPLAAWRGTSPKEPTVPAPKPMPGRIFFVNVPSAAQSTVMMMQLGPKRTAPDYFANTIMTGVFGGSFTSRLNMNLREDKGYAYGARGGFSYSKLSTTLTATAAVQADSTYQTLLEIDREMKELSTGKRPVTQDELDREKQNAVLALPGKFATAQAALGQYRTLVYYGLPLDYFNTYVDKVSKVSAAEVKHSASTHLRAAPAIYLIVGDGDKEMIIDDPTQPKDKRRVPYMKSNKPVTLRDALIDLAKRGDVGAGGLIELDVDGHVIRHD